MQKMVFKNTNAYNIDKIKDKITWIICLAIPNTKVDHQTQGSINYNI
jgi:hypothetical protein